MRILLVEDDPIIGFAAADALRNEGHEVVGPATTVDDAQHFAREGADFALVDINLAGHDEGVELARNLKSQFATSWRHRRTLRFRSFVASYCRRGGCLPGPHARTSVVRNGSWAISRFPVGKFGFSYDF
jgi:CheY-like chemotaxis protein